MSDYVRINIALHEELESVKLNQIVESLIRKFNMSKSDKTLLESTKEFEADVLNSIVYIIKHMEYVKNVTIL